MFFVAWHVLWHTPASRRRRIGEGSIPDNRTRSAEPPVGGAGTDPPLQVTTREVIENKYFVRDRLGPD